MSTETIDGIYLDDLVLRKEISEYEKTRQRIIKFYNNKSISDKEIIECLSKEIKQYRSRIKNKKNI